MSFSELVSELGPPPPKKLKRKKKKGFQILGPPSCEFLDTRLHINVKDVMDAHRGARVDAPPPPLEKNCLRYMGAFFLLFLTCSNY